MVPFRQIIPASQDPVMTIVLARKTGGVPKGEYGFLECYCTDPGCDCRRVLLVVFNEKMKQKAAICFGFDQVDGLDGPYLEPSAAQAPYAPALLKFFVDSLNQRSQWLELMYRHYRAVRQVADGKPYRGKALPAPGELSYRAQDAPETDRLIKQTLSELSAPPGQPVRRIHAKDGAKAAGKGKKAGAPAQTAGARMTAFLERYLYLDEGAHAVARHDLLQDDLKLYLLSDPQSVEELVALLPGLYRQSPQDDERIEAGLRLLFDALNALRLEIDRRRPAATLRMAGLQGALARRVYLENEDPDLRAAVANALLQSRVEILPVLREANNRLMEAAGAARGDLVEDAGEEMVTGIARSLESMGLTSPFDGAEALLQLFALSEPTMQMAVLAELLESDHPLLREVSALLLFHPNPEVRLGVSRVLASCQGSDLAPQTLRRLIVCRNWFPEEIRKQIDRTVHNARRARVECAPLGKPPALTVYASTVDGAGTQSFQVVIQSGKAYASCSILIKQRIGVVDAFVMPLGSKRELNKFLTMLKEEASFIQSSPEYLDLRVCQGLADGVRGGGAPNFWLLRIAELTGCDRWQALSFDPRRELAQLREQAAALCPGLADREECLSALEESAEWLENKQLLGSWFEDDAALDRAVEAASGKRRSPDAGEVIGRIGSELLEKRRPVWLERLVLLTLWLKSSVRAPVPWYRMLAVAEAVADAEVPLKAIPLMMGIAEMSYHAYLQRKELGKSKAGKR